MPVKRDDIFKIVIRMKWIMYIGKLAPWPQHATKMYRWSVGTARSMPDIGSLHKYVKKAPCYWGLRKTALDIHLIRYGVDLTTALHAAETTENCVRPKWVTMRCVLVMTSAPPRHDAVRRTKILWKYGPSAQTRTQAHHSAWHRPVSNIMRQSAV